MNGKIMKQIFEDYDGIHSYESIGSTLYGERSVNVEISIMIPTYMRLNYLPKAIKSSFFQVTDRTFKVVVIDNNPDTEE